MALLPVVVSSAMACDTASTIVGVNGVAAELTITVRDDGSDLPSGPVETLTLEVGQNASLAAVATNALGLAVSGTAVTWSASDYAVIEVTSDGVVTAVGAGSAEVYASAGEVSARLPVVVTAPEVVPPPQP
jgi:hypothetical protein